MSWGIKISILYIGFVILIVTMVGMTMGEKEDLVSKDYYEQEIKYQGRIDKINKTSELKEPLTWEVKTGFVLLKFPIQFKGENISGTVYFFRPSDAAMDKVITIPSDATSARNIPTNNLKNGLYKIEINWKAGKEEYYNEGTIQIK
jgi:hypothetical protein